MLADLVTGCASFESGVLTLHLAAGHLAAVLQRVLMSMLLFAERHFYQQLPGPGCQLASLLLDQSKVSGLPGHTWSALHGGLVAP